MHYCPRIKTLISTWDYRPNVLSVCRMRCRQWDCPYCAAKNADMWRAHLLETFTKRMLDQKWIFVTLTVPPGLHDLPPGESLKRLKAAWKPLYEALKRKSLEKIEYVLIFETHKSGIFHAHALINMGAVYDAYNTPINYRLPYELRIKAEKGHPFCKWLSAQAERYGLGWVVHATRIRQGPTGGDNARLAVGYLTKYLSKGMTEIVFPKRTRRIQTSSTIGSPRTRSKSKYAWTVKPAIHYKSVKTVPVWLIGEKRLLGPSDFGDDGYYPPLEFAVVC